MTPPFCRRSPTPGRLPADRRCCRSCSGNTTLCRPVCAPDCRCRFHAPEANGCPAVGPGRDSAACPWRASSAGRPLPAAALSSVPSWLLPTPPLLRALRRWPEPQPHVPLGSPFGPRHAALRPECAASRRCRAAHPRAVAGRVRSQPSAPRRDGLRRRLLRPV